MDMRATSVCCYVLSNLYGFLLYRGILCIRAIVIILPCSMHLQFFEGLYTVAYFKTAANIPTSAADHSYAKGMDGNRPRFCGIS